MTDFARRLDGIPIVSSTAERNTLYPTPATNQRVLNLETDQTERWDGAAWGQDGTTFSRLTVSTSTTSLQDVTATRGTFSDRVLVAVSGHQIELSGVGAAGDLVAGGWLSGVTEGLNITPNNDGVSGKKLVLGYFDGFIYRSAIEYASTTGSAVTAILISAPVTFSGAITSQSVTTGVLHAIGAVTLDLTLTVTGATTHTGTVGIGGAPAPSVGLWIKPTALTSTVQIGAEVRPVFNSAATAVGRNIDVLLATAAAAFTMVEGAGIYINSPSIGAGSAITTLYGLYIANQTGGGTNYAIFTAGGRVNFSGLPTSASGLATGDLWNSSGTLHIA